MTYAARQFAALDRLRDLQIDTILAGSVMDEHRPRFAALLYGRASCLRPDVSVRASR